MEHNTDIKKIYINLPIRDIARTRTFWTRLGFAFNEEFSDEKALCLVLKQDSIYAMLITHEYFQTFTNRRVADISSTQVLLAVDVGSRERVDEMMRIAVENGAVRYLKPEKHSWMYYDRFADLDGHQWEISYMDETLIPRAAAKQS